jgi:hypothetical protein
MFAVSSLDSGLNASIIITTKPVPYSSILKSPLDLYEYDLIGRNLPLGETTHNFLLLK